MQIAVLSPHRDDAAFSCGITLRALLDAQSRVTIVNVCTISQYAPYATEALRSSVQLVTMTRQQEDENFVAMLSRTLEGGSSQVEFVDLKWKDVPLRWCIEDREALDSLTLPPEEVQKLCNELSNLPQFDFVFVPMALGGHIDHRLVLQAATQIFPTSSLVFYEDLPYACRMSATERSSVGFAIENASRSEVWLPFQGSTQGLKKAYALCYLSQIAEDVAEEIEIYGLEHGGRERFIAGPEAMRALTTALHHEVVM